MSFRAIALASALTLASSLAVAPSASAIVVNPGWTQTPLSDNVVRGEAFYSAEFTPDALPTNGALRAGFQLRKNGGEYVMARAYVASDGVLKVQVVGRDGRTIQNADAGHTITANQRFHVEAEITGGATGDVRVRAWPAGQPRPAWDLLVRNVDFGSASGTASTYIYLSSTANDAIDVSNTVFWKRPAPYLSARTTSGQALSQGEVTLNDDVNIFALGGDCKIDNGSWQSCGQNGSEIQLRNLGLGSHTVHVKTISGETESLTFNVRSDAWGSFRPNTSNAGVPQGLALTTLADDADGFNDGKIAIDTTAHPQLANINGVYATVPIEVRKGDVTISNSHVRIAGPGPTTETGAISLPHYHQNAATLTIRDTTVEWGTGLSANDSRSADAMGIKGANITTERVVVQNVSDAANIDGGTFAIRGSLLHRGFSSIDNNQDNGASHNDGVQVSSGNGVRLVGNDIRGYRNAAVMLSPTDRLTPNGVNGLDLTSNWLDEGTCTVNYVSKGRPVTGVRVTDNLFGMNNSSFVRPDGTVESSWCVKNDDIHGAFNDISDYVVQNNRQIRNDGSIGGAAYIWNDDTRQRLG